MSINLPILTKFDSSGVDAAEGALGKFGKAVGAIAIAAAAITAGIVAKGLKDFADFDSKLQESVAIMGDVSDVMRDDMAEAAKLVGLNTKFSAEEAAESFFFLASAGLTASESIAALPQVALFAQAGMFDMATATDLATDAQSALGLTSDDAAENLAGLTRVTDVFVKANTLANTSVEQLAAAFTTKAGNAIKTVGKDLEEGAAALAVFADQGIKGELAGTLLTNTLFGLSDRAKAVPKEFERLGIAVFDADGNMSNLADIARDVTVAFDGLSTEQKLAELSNLGFSKQSRQGILALVGNSEALTEYESKLRDAGGTAEEVAAKQMNSLTGDLILMNSAFANASLVIGEAFEPAARGLVGALTPIVKELTPLLAEILDDLSPKIERVAKNISEFVTALSSGEGRADLFQNISDSIKNFFAGGGLKDALLAFNQFRFDLIKSILDALPGILEGFVKVLPLVIAFLANEFIPTLIDQFVMISTELVRVLADALPMIIQAIADTIPGILAALSEMLPVILERLLSFIPEVLTAALEIFNSLIDALLIIVPQLITTVIELLPQLVETVLGMLPEFIDSALELFNGLITALVEIIPMLLTAILDALPSILLTVVGMLPELLEAGIELFMGLVMAVVDILPELLVAIVELLPEITAAVVGMIPELLVAGIDLFLALVTALIDATPEILTAIIGLIPEITGALISAMPQMVAAGFDLLTGLAKGIYDNLPRIASNIASSIGSSITNSVKSFFGIESPSKLFAGIGGDLAAGLEQGIQDSKDLAVGASLEMASEVKFASDSAFDGVSAGAMFTPSFGNTSKKQKSAGSNINITINAGIGSDPVSIGRGVVDAIKRYESVSGKVFVSA